MIFNNCASFIFMKHFLDKNVDFQTVCSVDLFRYLPSLCTTQGQSECWLTLLHPFCLLTSFPLYQTDDGFWIEKITFRSLQNFPFCWFLIKIFLAELSRKRYGIFNYMWGCVSESENVAVNKKISGLTILFRKQFEIRYVWLNN